MRIASSCTEFSAIWSALVDRRGGEHADALDPIRVADRPLERVHAAHRAADDSRPRGRCRVRRRSADLRGDLVADREVREARRPLVAVGGERRGAGGALASAEHVRRDHEPAVGVDRAARADDVRPPAGGRMPGPGRPATWLSPVSACSTSTALLAVGVELAPGLVGDAHAREVAAALECGTSPSAANWRSPGRVALAPGAGGRRLARAAAARWPP